MKRLSVLIAVLAGLSFATLSMAKTTHCTHAGSGCVPAEASTGTNMTAQDLTP